MSEEYRDTGCDWHPKCLTCPFAQCRYDLPHVVGVQVRQLDRMGRSVPEISRMLGVSRATVYRHLEETRNA